MSERDPTPGDRWRDRDPRSAQLVTVLEVTDRHVFIQRQTVRTRVRRDAFTRRFTPVLPTSTEHTS